MAGCLKCGDTGITVAGEECECGAGNRIELPLVLEVPEQYQQAVFDKSFLPNWLHPSYGSSLQGIISTVRTTLSFKQNILICAPPNSGKTVFAFSLYRLMYSAGLIMPNILDLNEIRKMLADNWNKSEDYDLLVNSKLAVIKIPMDVPNRVAELLMTIIDLRVRHSGATIFLYDGSYFDLKNQDKYEKFEFIKGDGNYHTLKVYSYSKNKEDDLSGEY